MKTINPYVSVEIDRASISTASQQCRLIDSAIYLVAAYIGDIAALNWFYGYAGFLRFLGSRSELDHLQTFLLFTIAGIAHFYLGTKLYALTTRAAAVTATIVGGLVFGSAWFAALYAFWAIDAENVHDSCPWILAQAAFFAFAFLVALVICASFRSTENDGA
jgi:hypothetical protein